MFNLLPDNERRSLNLRYLRNLEDFAVGKSRKQITGYSLRNQVSIVAIVIISGLNTQRVNNPSLSNSI